MIHGTKKQKKIKTEQEIKEQQELSNKINSKLSDFFIIRHKPFEDEQVPKYLEFTALLMQLCSDIPTIFNFRRELLERVLKINQNDPQKQGQSLVYQLKLITKLIKSDPKSYTLWNFRQWMVQKIYKINKKVVVEEKMLCKMLLMKDEKNFHVWNYRNWVNSVQVNLDQEIAFTEQKIKSNPFNFSPYHFRSKHLAQKYTKMLSEPNTQQSIKRQIQKYGMPKELFNAQMESIRTAVFLNPNEQAPWTYYNWLLKRILPVIALDIKRQGQKTKIILNERVKGMNKMLTTQGQDKAVFMNSDEKLSQIWQFSSNKQITLLDSSRVVQTEGMTKRIIMKTQLQIISEMRQIYQEQQTFIKQILQEQPNCRFAWFQLLELLKNQFLITCNEDQWVRITTEGQKSFQILDKQQKTRNYIQRIRQYWFRISKTNNLTEQQKLLVYSKN